MIIDNKLQLEFNYLYLGDQRRHTLFMGQTCKQSERRQMVASNRKKKLSAVAQNVKKENQTILTVAKRLANHHIKNLKLNGSNLFQISI